jgi:hypothetical protein
MSPSKQKFKHEKMWTGTDATAHQTKQLFRLELDHRFGFTPFYGYKWKQKEAITTSNLRPMALQTVGPDSSEKFIFLL